MPNKEPGKIRNVAVIGHRGTGKTSLVESLLYEAGATTRLGSVADGNTVADFEEEGEEARPVDRLVAGASRVARPLDQPDRHAGGAQLPG
jgi:molybdopterin-guanine dinucleotide biosynthesis protein